MENQKHNEKKWYDNTPLLIILLFLFAPLCIYGVFKRKNTVLWKKLVFTFFGIGYLLFIIPMIIAVIYVANLDNYEEGNNYYKKEEYSTAIDYFSKVEKNDKNYYRAQQKIKEINSKLSQIEIQKKQEREVQLSKLMDYQKVWADSIVKSESQPGNRHFVGSKVIAPDSIIFEYTERITKNGFKENFNIDTLVYKQHYQKSISHKFGKEYEDIKTIISFIPNKKIDFKKVIADNNAKAERQQKIQMMFSAWDGSHSGLKRLVKSNMNDPSSFDHVETNYSDKGSYILVQMRFRGNNSFGAKVLNIVTAKVDLDGNILSISN